MAQNYSSYLRTEALLALQDPLSAGPEHDEMLFIVTHQVYELWFKQILHELDEWSRRLGKGELSGALQSMGRVLQILGIMVQQLDLLSTMTPLAFAKFRPHLDKASGFQSAQFREIEAALGLHDTQAIKHFTPGSPEHQRIQARCLAPDLWEHFVQYAEAQGFRLSKDRQDEAQDAELLRLYRSHPQAASLAESLVDLDEALALWRYRHIKMVQRTIGAKLGTGGSAGVAYLRGTLGKEAFPPLWRVRTMM